MSVSSLFVLLTSKVVIEHGNELDSFSLFFPPHQLYFAPSGGVFTAPAGAKGRPVTGETNSKAQRTRQYIGAHFTSYVRFGVNILT